MKTYSKALRKPDVYQFLIWIAFLANIIFAKKAIHGRCYFVEIIYF